MENPSPQRTVFLIGFMASGKTTVGRELARRLDLDFIDLDNVIESSASKAIPDIFASEGEDGFRALEAAALDSVIAGAPAVVATGGGTPCFGDQLDNMRASGLVVALDAPLEVLLGRAGDGSGRPLLSSPAADVAALYESRVPVYRRAHATVVTNGRTTDEVVARIERVIAATSVVPASELEGACVVGPAGDPYPVVVERDGLRRLGDIARAVLPQSCRKLGIISDDNVAPLYLDGVTRDLRDAGYETTTVVVPAGEGAKSLSSFGRVIDELVVAGLDRSSAIVALGGGVVGDLAGYVASSLYRGVRVIQVPTTLLAMTDSSIGGKTGINIAAGKNLVGAFWQPSFVLAGTRTLETLPQRERRAAFGELIKYGLLDGDELYEQIAALAPELGGRNELSAASAEVTDVVRRCASYKAWVVTRDERESGERALLNLGHTVGHAIEAVAGYGVVLHGEAVGLGLVAACRVSHRLGMCDATLEQRVVETLTRAGLDADVDPWLRPDVIDRIGVDKKRTGSRVRFVTVRRPGAPELTDIELSELSRILRA